MTTLLIPTCGVAAVIASLFLAHDVCFGAGIRIRRRIGAICRHGVPSGPSSQLFRGFEFADGSGNNILIVVQRWIEQAGLAERIRRLMSMTAMLIAVLMIIAARLGLGQGGICLTAIAGASVLPVFIAVRRRRRLEQLRHHLSEAFDVMSRAVQAGQTIASSLQLVATECHPLVANEFAACCEQLNLGLSFDAALRELARRIPVTELHILAIALIVQRQCGGSPVEVMNNMSELIRKRMRLQQRLRALTGEGRMQAVVLTVLPLATFLGLVMFRPDYAQPLLARPQLLIAICLADIAGGLWIRRIIQLDY